MTMPGDVSAGNKQSCLTYLFVMNCNTADESRLPNFSHVTSGHVGAPLPCNSVKLVDVPEMNYLAANGEGEVKTATDEHDLVLVSRIVHF